MLKGILLVLFGACSFGILSTFVKLAYADGYSLSDVTGTQAFFGAILLWLFYFIQTKTSKKVYPKPVTKWYKLLASGAFTGLVSMFYYQCVKLVPASLAIILLMQFVWLSVLLELFCYKKKPSKMQVLAIAIILGGTVLASGFTESNASEISIECIIYGMLAALCYACLLYTSRCV